MEGRVRSRIANGGSVEMCVRTHSTPAVHHSHSTSSPVSSLSPPSNLHSAFPLHTHLLCGAFLTLSCVDAFLSPLSRDVFVPSA